jgi:hypothetical protein
MKRWLSILGMLTFAVAALVQETSHGQPGAKPADLGPGEQGATLKLPGAEPAPPPPGAGNPELPYFLQKSFGSSAKPGNRIALPPSNPTDINKDIEITPDAGSWAIFLMAYTGPKAPVMARQFVKVLRENYRLSAYVFNYGAEEKKKEFERVQKIRQEQREALIKAGLNTDMPIHVPAMRIDEQTGVLIGGFKSFDEASNAVKTIKKLNTDGLRGKVDLDLIEVQQETFTYDAKSKQMARSKTEVALDESKQKGLAYDNPFMRAFPARNPAVKWDQVATSDDDLKYLQKINSGEPLSLLQSKKPYTLAVKQFNMQYKTVGNAKEANGFIDRFDKSFLFKKGEWQDNAAHMAHDLADGLRKSGFPETFVLHCRHCSYVTIGAFDAVQDPQLVAMQNYLETHFRQNAHPSLEMYPRPMVMPVPGVAKFGN